MDNKDVQSNKPLTKKEKADIAGRDVAEVAARGAGRYYGGSLGGAAVDVALNTKAGQKVIGNASKQLNKNVVTRNLLAKNQQNISRAKPIANTLMSSMGGKSGTNGSSFSSIDNFDSVSDSYGDVNNNTTDSKGSGTFSLSAIWNKLSLKTKLIVMGVIVVFLLIILFVIIMVAPLMSLGIIDIGGFSGDLASSGGYSSISGSTAYWWPIGSDEVTTSNGVQFASGDPASVTLTSYFGTREDPFGSGATGNHSGIDLASGQAPGVTNVIAAKDGKVTSVVTGLSCVSNSNKDSCGGGYGYHIMIEHNDGTVTLYAHLYEGSITVQLGDTVKQGQVIGKMGSTGQSTGNHLHFEVRVNGSRVDPLNYVDLNNPRPTSKNFSGDISYISGSSNMNTVCLTLRNSGFSDNSVVALMTNINHESGFNPGIHGDDGTSYGLCQWHLTRYDNLRNSFPGTFHTIESQIKFLMYELENSFTGVYSALVDGTASASDLTYKFCAEFEVPYDTHNTCMSRANAYTKLDGYVRNGCKET